eukprot:PITA_29499
MEELAAPQGSSSPSPPSAAEAFRSLFASLSKKKVVEAAKFVKRIEYIHGNALNPEGPIQVALSLADRALNKVTSYFFRRGYFLFELSEKEDKDLIFRNGPYFMGHQGLYLNKWTLDFDPAVYVPFAVPVWVRLPNLPVHCWNWDSSKHIGNTLGKFIDKANNEDQYDCAKICVELYLEVRIPEAIKIRVGPWVHVQKMDYEKLLFKWWKCQVYGHSARDFPSKGVEEKGKEEVWNHETEIPKEGSIPKSKIIPERSKRKMSEEEEETQESKESEEEGEIRDSQSTSKRSTRG